MVAHFSARSIQVSIAGRRATPASGERLIAEPLFMEWMCRKAGSTSDTCGRALRVANEETAIAAAFKGPWSSCADMVCEATGGYERALSAWRSSAACRCAGCTPIAPAPSAK